MSKTNKQNQLFKGEVTNKKRMYKAKKQWVVAGATVAMGLSIIGLSNTTEVHADAWVPNTAAEIATRLDVNSGSYTFIEGDTYWELAQVLNIKPFKLMEMNGLSDGDQYTIPVGHVVHWDGNHVTVKDTEGNIVSDVVIRDEDKVDPAKPVAGQNSDTPKIPVQSDSNGNVIGNTNSNSNNGINNNANNGNNSNGNNNGTSNDGNANIGNNGGTNTEKPNDNNSNNGNNEEKPVEPETPATPEQKQYTVSVLHKDEDGNVLLKESDIKVDENSTFTANAQSFDGYTLEGTATQEVKVDSDKVITFTYIKNENPTPEVEKFDVVIKYVDAEGNELAESETVQVEKGENYTATGKTIEGYSLDGEATQTVTVDSNTEITFTYTKNTAPLEKFDITVKYVDEDGKEIAVADKTEVEKGQVFTATAKTIEGYTLKGSTTQSIAVNSNATITFNYIKDAEPVTKYKVTVEHKDADGNILETESAIEVEAGKQFTAQSKTFDGYTLNGESTQTITVNGDATITFVYTKDTEIPEVVKHTVRISHTGYNENNIMFQLDYEEIQVEEGQTYTAHAKTFLGYTLDGDETQSILVDGNKFIEFKYKVSEVAEEDLTAIANVVSGNAMANINAHRKEFNSGLVNIDVDSAIQSGVNKRAEELAILFEHARPNGGDGVDAVYDYGYAGLATGENIGSSLNVTLEWIVTNGASELVTQWKESLSHNNYMLASDVNEGAVGVYIKSYNNGFYDMYFAYIGGINSSKPQSSLETARSLASEAMVEGNTVESTVESTEEKSAVESSTIESTVESIVEEPTVETSEVEPKIEATEESIVVEQPETVDKSVLIETYNTSNTLSEETYSVESWNHFILVKAEAKQVFDDVNATQEQVANATEALKQAINNLN